MVFHGFTMVFSGFLRFFMGFTNLSMGFSHPPSVRLGSAERSHGAAEGHGAATDEFHRAGAGKKPWIIDHFSFFPCKSHGKMEVLMGKP